MDKFGNWMRIILTWVTIIPDLAVSYLYLKNPNPYLEITSLALNFVATTVLFYIYMDISNILGSDETESDSKNAKDQNKVFLYKLAFGPLIEDMAVWMGLFFALYNIVPVTLFLHNVIAKFLINPGF